MSQLKHHSLNFIIPALSIAGCACVYAALMHIHSRRRRRKSSSCSGAGGYESLIGNTPLVKLEKLSKMIERDIFVKMESMNPGGTGKDRAAFAMISKAEEDGLLPKCGGGVVVEGTSGSTGIALAAICNTHGHECIIVMPDDQALEKQDLLRHLGAKVEVVKCAAISNPKHYVNVARQIAKDLSDRGKHAFFTNQFENGANFVAHYTTTGPEIWEQTGGKIDSFVMSSGTGGTISGVGVYLKSQDKNVKVILVDPPGSSLFNKVKYGVAYTSEQKEQGIRRHRYDTIAEGIGLDRVTHNFSLGLQHGAVDDAILISDQEAVEMAHWLIREEGFFVGSSSAMNIMGAVKSAMEMEKGSQIVTIICDSGQRHITRFWNKNFIELRGLSWPVECPSLDKYLRRCT